MKIAVIGAARRTRRSSSPVSRRSRSASSCCTTSTPSDAPWSARWRAACSSVPDSRGSSSSPASSTARSTAPTSCSSRSGSADRRRGSRTRRFPLACGCIGQETTGAGGFAKALRTVPVVLDIAEHVGDTPPTAPGSWTSRTPWESSRARCSTAAIAPSASATSRSASSGSSRSCSASTPTRSSSTRSASITSPGCDRLGGGEDVLPALLADHGDELAADVGEPRRLLDELGVVPSYYLKYFYAHDEVLASNSAEQRRARAGRRDRARAPRAVPRPDAEREACAARAARRCVLQRSSSRACRGALRRGPVHVVDIRNGGTLDGLQTTT